MQESEDDEDNRERQHDQQAQTAHSAQGHKINKSYSRVSAADIAEKLALSSMENALNIVSKAIRVESKGKHEMYATNVLYAEYAQRIKHCLKLQELVI